MIYATNIILIIIVGLIAYWWANQGFFSALLHLLCTIVAGAIALAFWEPLTSMFLSGSWFDDYAWGVTLIGVFAIALLALRIICDKAVPANVAIPRWANLVFGGAAGAGSGVLAVGILIIGIGHIQSSAKIAGFRDVGRSSRTGEVMAMRGGSLWVPFHRLTDEFYGWLSVTSLRTSRPLRHYSPGLHQQASLVRDSFDAGKGKLSLLPSAARVEAMSMEPDRGGVIYYVKMRFGVEAQDFGEQLTLSASQIRLIGEPNPPRTGKAPFAHPYAWTQFSGRHIFDNISHYVSSEPGKESSSPVFEFKVPSDFVPAFIQIRGTRYRLPQATRGRGPVAGASTAEPIPTGGGSIQSVVRVSNDIRPVQVSTNSMPAGIEERDKYLTEGKGLFDRGGRLVSRTLRIEGIFEPTGTKCVRVDVSRDGPADIFALSSQVSDGARLRLIDAEGQPYTPVGYMHTHPDGVTIELQPQKRTATLDDIPILPTSGDQTLELLFYVTENAVVRGLRFGDVDVGTCNVVVEGRSR